MSTAASDASMGELVKQLSESKVAQATPPVPEQATESVKEDVQWARTRAQQGRR